MKNLKIGDWVKITKTASFKSELINISKNAIPYIVHNRLIQKKDFTIPQIGQIVGIALRYIGQYKKHDPIISNEKGFFDIEIDDSLIIQPKAVHLWEVRLGMMNHPIICCDEDVEPVDCTGLKLPLLKTNYKKDLEKDDPKCSQELN